jgi:thiol-disulfide isomerase/thioredoxin
MLSFPARPWAGALVAVFAVVVALGACPASPPDNAPASSARDGGPAGSAPAATAPAPAAGGRGPRFLEDDTAAAVTAARAAGKVVFVDAWAPWCHTCLSMQRDVLSQPALARFEDRVVFVAVDTDREENAAFLAAYPVKLWPTFFVLDAASEAPLAVHPGSMSLAEMVRFLEGALVARDAATTTDPQAQALLAAHAAVSAGQPSTAAAAYARAAQLPGPRRTEAILGGLRAFPDPAACVVFGIEHLHNVHEGGAAGDVAANLLSCAAKLPPDAPARHNATARATARLVELRSTPAVGASVDDRADVLALLADRYKEDGDTAAFTAAHTERLKLLEDDAAQAKSIDDARVHDYARMNSYLALGRGGDAVKMLTERTTQLPRSYEAWARLSSTLFKLGRLDEARVAVERAIALSYGTRRLRYLDLRADIAAARKDPADERAALQLLVDDGGKLPRALGAESLVQTARARLAGLSATPR